MTSDQMEINGLRATLSAVLAAVVDPLIPVNHEAPAATNHPVHRANRAAKAIEELRKVEFSKLQHLPTTGEARHLQRPWQELIFTLDTSMEEAQRKFLPLEEIMRRRAALATEYLGRQAVSLSEVREETFHGQGRCEFRMCGMTVDTANRLARYIYELERQVDWSILCHPWAENQFRPAPPSADEDRYVDSD